MRRAVITALAIAALSLPAHAAQPTLDEQVAALRARADAVRDACNETPDDSWCQSVAEANAVSLASELLLLLTSRGDKSASLPWLERAAVSRFAELRTQAAYGYARLRPDEADTSRLLALLFDQDPAVRRGAWGALNLSSDPVARPWVERVAAQKTGRNEGLPPFDVGGLGVPLPDGAVFNIYESGAASFNMLVFAGGGDTGILAGHFLGQPGARETSIDVLAAAALPDGTRKASARLANAAWFANPRLIALDLVGQEQRRFVAVFDDVQLGKPGFALIAADRFAEMPPPPSPFDDNAPEPNSVDVSDPAAAFDELMAEAYNLAPSIPAGEADDISLWGVAKSSGPAGARLYLAFYPDGVFNKEATAQLSTPGIAAAALSYAERQPITVRLENLPEGAKLTVAVVNRGAPPLASGWPQTDLVGRPSEVTLDQTLTANIFEVRLYAETLEYGKTEIARDEFRIVPAEAALTLAKTSFRPNEPIEVSFAGMLGDNRDFISIAKAGANPEDYGEPWTYLEGKIEGQVTLKAPSMPGDYEVRAYFRDDRSIVRGSMKITIAGEPSVGPVPVLKPSKSVYAPGEVMAISFENAGGDRRDYITIVQKGTPDSRYGTYVYLEGRISGEAALTAPTETGDYELRLSFADKPEPVRARVNVVVK